MHISPMFNDENPPSLVWFDTETEARIDDVIEWAPGAPGDNPPLVVSPTGVKTFAINPMIQTMCEIPASASKLRSFVKNIIFCSVRRTAFGVHWKLKL